MHLILTHEQADFDSVAALAAVRLIETDALAVLPRRLNRNVQAFLDLYGEALPFLEYADLPRGRVSRITLVDTQDLPQLRGATEETPVHVVDHHPPDPKLDPSWGRQIEEVGATTTLLVESLQETNTLPGLAASTLLLLGIYEDTGSLSYGSTTARDVRACAWLLDCGASLAIAMDYLTHPLTPDQRRVYERLLESATSIELQGLSIVVACAEAGGQVEEISTLAHRLRDLLDPDGLFVLVALDGHVQLVARATTEAIDVARAAQHFGGGGHDRAAAALIRDRSLADVRRELLNVLPGCMRPTRSVGEIMSRMPQLLDPATRVDEAAQLMQRFGHEGYPVVREGRVVGLLTRRAVDRAMAHGMGGQPVERVMNAGALTVGPGDSVQHLQRVMVQQDWGQVPVADPESGEIVGIVTRTDLLRTLAAPGGAQAPNLSARMQGALSPARFELLRLVGRHAEQLGAALYLVGGFVRDLLLEIPAADFDLVVEGDAIGLARALAEAYGGRTSSHRRFGTAKWRLDRDGRELQRAMGLAPPAGGDLPSTLDFVSARTEFYTHPTSLPSVERGSIQLDLHRRDFTVNTLALRLDGRFFGQLLDPWGGGRDLKDGLIRALHSISFVDDPTRMLRAVRLEQRLGFRIEARTAELLTTALPLLGRVSGERLRNELRLIFVEDCLPRILERLDQLGLLSAIHSALRWDPWLDAAFGRVRGLRAPASWRIETALDREALYYALWLFRTSEAEAGAICERLHLPASIRGTVLDANRLGREAARWPGDRLPSQIVAVLDGSAVPAVVATWVGLQEAPAAQALIGRYLAEWRHIAPRTSGQCLRELGLPPSPAYREILTALRAAWLDGGVRAPADEEILLARLVEEARGRV